jgi:CHAD domain-containing protein
MKRRWKDDKPLRENLQRRLPKIAAQYFRKGRKAMRRGTSWEDMHEFRLATKRLRYTLELFRTLYGPGLERRLDELKRVQTLLGEVNDCVLTDEMLEAISGTDAIRAKLALRAKNKTNKMRRYWEETFDAPGAEQSWTRYLAVYAARPSTPAPVPVRGNGGRPKAVTRSE